jgi:tetratricopeptide (TPR) repeat protein
VLHSVARIQLVVRHLISEQHYEDAAAKVLDFILYIQSQDQWKPLFESLQLIPEDIRRSNAQVAAAYSNVLMGNRMILELLQFTDAVASLFDVKTNARILVDRAFALFHQNKNDEAQQTLILSIPHLQEHLLGVALRRLGVTQFRLGRDWQTSFEQALELQQGRALGLTLLDYASCLADDGQSERAQFFYTKALSYFQHDSFHSAWLRFNLGNNALRLQDPEAEQHFLIGEYLTRKPQAKGLRSAVLRGLATFRRSKGEFTRAEFMFRQAIQCALEPDDNLIARQGLARTLRLSGQADSALEEIETAIHQHGAAQGLLVTRAITYLALNRNNEAHQDLKFATPLADASSQHLAIIVQAELERRAGNNDTARELLQKIPLETLQTKEESRAFPSLFALLETKQPRLKYISQTKVEVNALGVLQVKVNGRFVPIAPTSRVGELLVFMLEQGGTASLELLTDALYPEAIEDIERDKARKAIWKLTRDLRQALGWQNSICALRSAYQLDRSAKWLYDASDRNAKASGFLSGIYSNWVLETAREFNNAS